MQPGDEFDVAGACLDCRTIFLIPFVADDPGLAGGLAAAGLCTRCEGLVVAVEAAEQRLADMVVVVRMAGSLHFATLVQLVDSWRVAPPSPLAALAELGPVGPDVLDVFDVGSASATTRRAIGSLLVKVLGDLLRAAAGHEDPDAAAHAVLLEHVTPGRPSAIQI